MIGGNDLFLFLFNDAKYDHNNSQHKNCWVYISVFVL